MVASLEPVIVAQDKLSKLHVACYLNENRPQLLDPTVTRIPLDTLGPDLSSQLEDSLRVDPSDSPACAKSARLWESILESHPVPYLLLRVADMRMTLGSAASALTLYEDLQKTLQDAEFGNWVCQTRSQIFTETQRQLLQYKTSGSFNPSQRWRSTAQTDDGFPYCKLQRVQIDLVSDLWQNKEHPETTMVKYTNLHCLETNALEGTFEFDTKSIAKLIRFGFYNGTELADIVWPIGGTVRNRADALSILQDTHQALNELLSLLKSDPPVLTVETICHLHKTLMKTSQVLDIHTASGRQRLVYLNIGITRQVSRINVTATSLQGVKVQFCPFDEVDYELKIFCERFNELVQRSDVDPFAAAAWISHVFVAIHPFEDGNGRLSRILSSIPLMKKGLPPLCIPANSKSRYHILLNNIRANRDGDYQLLMEFLYSGTKASVDLLEAY